MNGIYFGDYHSYNDFNLILSSKTIGSPNPKMAIIDIPGSDGQIDLTDYFGEIFYTNRVLEFNFATKVPTKDFLTLFTEIQNKLHGKVMKIVLDEDLDYYYYGRVIVSEWASNKRIGLINISVDAEPYKYKLYKTRIVEQIVGSEDVILLNGRKKVIPTIICDSDMNVIFNGKSYSFSAGTYTPEIIPDFILNSGGNIISLNGNGTITFEYQEGDL